MPESDIQERLASLLLRVVKWRREVAGCRECSGTWRHFYSLAVGKWLAGQTRVRAQLGHSLVVQTWAQHESSGGPGFVTCTEGSRKPRLSAEPRAVTVPSSGAVVARGEVGARLAGTWAVQLRKQFEGPC